MKECIEIPSELITNHFDVDLFSHGVPDISDGLFIDPWFQFTHPTLRLVTSSEFGSNTIGWFLSQDRLFQEHLPDSSDRCHFLDKVEGWSLREELEWLDQIRPSPLAQDNLRRDKTF